MITGEVKNKLDKLWYEMWSNGMTNPLANIQQLTYLIFIKMLDDNQQKQERKINDQIAHGIPASIDDINPVFKSGNYVDTEKGIDVPYKDLRWKEFKHFEPSIMFNNVKNNVFPFIKALHGDKETAFANFMKDAQFTIPTPYILCKVVDCLSDETLGLGDKDMMGDCYEYLLSKLSTSGDAGQFRTPRHIIEMMVEMAKPTLNDTVIDPAMGTAGFLTGAAKYVQANFERELMNREKNRHFNNTMFTGFDVDPDMLRIGCMNMTLHGVENPTIKYNNSLEDDYDESDKYSLILANPPFAGGLNAATVSKTLTQISGGTRKTELLFLSLFLRVLETNGRCFAIIPVGVLNNSDKAYTRIRKTIIEEQQLEGVIFLPSGVFYPYSGVQTGIIIFRKTNCGGTKKVWFYNMEHDGFSLDQKRNAVAENDIPDILSRWNNLAGEEERSRYEKSFLVDKQEIVDNDYVLSFNKYQKKEIVKKEYRSTDDILSSISALENEFKTIMDELTKGIK